MNLIGAIIGGTIGAAIGATIWAVTAYYTNYEVGWIAWGIGALSGFGVAIGARGQGGVIGGVIAVVLSLAGIAGGKWGAIELSYRSFFESDDYAISAFADNIVAENEEAGRPSGARPSEDAESISETYAPYVWEQAQARWAALSLNEKEQIKRCPALTDPDFVVIYIANQLAGERESNGESLQWPAGMDYESAWRKAHFPTDVWNDAESRWSAMNADDQAAYRTMVIDAMTQHNAEGLAEMHAQASTEGFLASFGMFDLLWVILAVGSAFQIGSRGHSRQDQRVAHAN